jgi:hypothetical protein
MTEAERARWQSHLTDYEVQPLFPQVAWAPYRLPENLQKTKELMVLAGRNFSSSRMLVQKDSSYILCANLLGSMMGEKLYKGYREQVFSLSFLKMLFNKRIDNTNFDKTYYETIEIVENLPESFKSKTDKL